MYRQLQRQSSLTQIYCSNEQWCDLNCGKFHTRPQHFQHSQVRQLVGAIEMAAFSGANKGFWERIQSSRHNNPSTTQ
jgi:hypothetical protein